MPFGITGIAGIFIEDNVTVWNKNSNDTLSIGAIFIASQETGG